MTLPKLIPVFSLVVFLCLASTMNVAAAATPTVMATLSARSAKPGEHLELLVTVHDIPSLPSISLPERGYGLRFHSLGKPRLVVVNDEQVWLFRYRVTPEQEGDVVIPPIQITEGNRMMQSKPLFLHVSKSGASIPLTAKELAFGVNIPESLSEEVLKAIPTPTPQPTPTPIPPDTRSFGEKAASSCWKAIKVFWNYPGK